MKHIYWAPKGRHSSRQRQMLAPKVPLLRSSYFLCPCLPRVPFRALPSLHPGLCRSVVPTALVISLNFDTITLRLRTTNRIQRSSPPHSVVSLLRSSKYALMHRTQGLRPGLWKCIAPLGLFVRLETRAEKGMPYYTAASKNEVRKFETLSETLYSSIEITWLTKQKQRLRFLFSKPRRSLCRLRLKFVQTTRVVCTDFSWSLQKVLRTYKFKYVYSLKCLRVLIIVSACTYNNEYVVLTWGICRSPPPLNQLSYF